MDLEDDYGISQEDRALELQTFREKWRQELCRTVILDTNRKDQRDNLGSSSESSTRSRFEIAEEMFLEATKEERCGNLQEAVSLYRRAMQLDPEIELKIEKPHDGKSTGPKQQKEPRTMLDQEVPLSIQEDSVVMENVLSQLRDFDVYQHGTCFPETKNLAVSHISALPYEILQYLVQWIISSELDLLSLEKFARVCRGFYKVSREPLIWKKACQRIWGAGCGKLEETNYSSWREMLIERPQVRFNGIYISRVSYERPGETSFIDQSSQYRPWHNVLYYRFFRFFADGSVLYANTPDEPVNMVARMRLKQVVPNKEQNQILRGHYMLSGSGDSVVIFLQRDTVKEETAYRRRRARQILSASETLKMELVIRSTRERLHARLDWRRFAINRVAGNSELQTNIDINHQQFPSVHFSRVKSYCANAEAPLL